MVMSRAYQQSSRARPELRVRDPLNRWLAYQNPRRLDAEFIRTTRVCLRFGES